MICNAGETTAPTLAGENVQYVPSQVSSHNAKQKVLKMDTLKTSVTIPDPEKLIGSSEQWLQHVFCGDNGSIEEFIENLKSM